jgi:hypothetical protein
MEQKGGGWTKSNLTHSHGVVSHLTHAEARRWPLVIGLTFKAGGHCDNG